MNLKQCYKELIQNDLLYILCYFQLLHPFTISSYDYSLYLHSIINTQIGSSLIKKNNKKKQQKKKQWQAPGHPA